MQVSQGGVSLWYGTQDAPAPSGTVPAGGDQTVTIGLQPPDPVANIFVLYRINHGPPLTAPARPTPPVAGKQYFHAQLVGIKAGDKVEYVAVYRSGSRQIPSHPEAETHVVTFTVAPAIGGADTDRPAGAHASAQPARGPGAADLKGSPREAGSLGKAQLFALARAANSTVLEIRRTDPTLFAYLASKIGAQRKTDVLRCMKGASRPLLAALKTIDYAPTSSAVDTIAKVVDAGLAAQKADTPDRNEATLKITAAERSGRLIDIAQLDTPIARHPLFQRELNEAELYKLTDSVKLADSKAARLGEMAGSPALVDDDLLAALVTERTLTEAEAESLGLLLSLCLLAGGRADLAIEIKGRIASLPDLVKVSQADWLEAITKTKARAPDGLDGAGYASALRRAAANLYPAEALYALGAPGDMKLLEQALSSLEPLATKNDKMFSKTFEELDHGAAGGQNTPALQAAHRELCAFAHRHPGLGLIDVLNGHETPAEKIAELSKRLEVLKKLRAQNPDHEFMGLDYTEGSDDRGALNTDGLGAADLHMAVADLKAAQRVHALTKDVDHADAVMAAGYASGCEIAADDAETFRAKTGFDAATARRHHDKAKAALSRASHGVISATGAYDGLFHRMPVGNVRTSVKDHLKSIPGFSELFGSQDYCNCTECQSILGAPAYFVDLMTFVEEHLTRRVFRGKKAKDALNLKVRRPDLWTLPLTCDNTNTRVPYLDIINPTLENYIAVDHLGHKGGLSDRKIIESAVYQKALATSDGSFHQPFTLPLERLDTYLEHFATPRARIAHALGAEPAVIVKATLKISEAVYKQLTDANPDHQFLKNVYAQEFSFVGPAGHVNPLDVKTLLKATGYARADLERAVTTRFVTRDGAHKIEIRSARKNADSVQNDVERISGLAADALHRLYRFTKLHGALPWSIAELDLMLTQLGAAGSAIGDDAAVLHRIVENLALHARWSIPLDELCSLWGPISTEPKGTGLFERLFNPAPLARIGETFPRPEVTFVHWMFSDSGKSLAGPHAAGAVTASPDAHDIATRLLAGLQVSDVELAALIANLAKAIGADPTNAVEPRRGFVLSLANLTLLFRHALLARLLNLGIDDLFKLIELTGLAHAWVSDLDDLIALLELFDWYQTCGHSLGDLWLVTHGAASTSEPCPNAGALAGKLMALTTADHALEFSDRVFMSLLGLSEGDSQQMIAANPTLFVAVQGAPTPTFTLGSSFDQNAAIAIPDGVALDLANNAVILTGYAGGPTVTGKIMLAYHPVMIVPSMLGGLLGIDSAMLPPMLSMAGVDLYATDLMQALQAGAAAPATAPPVLTAIIARLIPLKVLFGGGAYGPDDLSFIQGNASVFGIADFNALTLLNIRKLSTYQRFAANLLAAGAADATPLRNVLKSFSSSAHFQRTAHADLAATLGVAQGQLSALLPALTLPATAPEALASLATTADIATRLGLGAAALKLTLSDQYDEQTVAADALLGAFRAQFHAEQPFTDKFQPRDDHLNSRKRDALTDYLLAARRDRFGTLDDLYNYFLLDVQLEGVMRTSWVVAAISSVQLYVYRCIMNLEQDQRDPSDPDHIEVRLDAEATEEWEWRQNYRVWQANREVFLFPESYTLPALRDDKTPLFEDLESALLQQPITNQNVLDAYATYLSGLDQLSRLKIAGAFHDIDTESKTDVLHLFGVTPANPPTFFYRTIENATHGETETDRAVTYTPWTPVNLQIHCRQLSPIVYLGRLFVFWTHITTAPINLVANANSIFGGYKHTWRVNYSSLRLDQTWTPPQQLAMTDAATFPQGDGVVLDPVLDSMDKLGANPGAPPPYFNEPNGFFAFEIANYQFGTYDIILGNYAKSPSTSQTNALNDYNTWQGKRVSNFNFNITDFQNSLIPLYDFNVHTAAIDGYTLTGFQWERVYPSLSADARDVLLTGRNFVMRSDRTDFYNQAVLPAKPAKAGGGAQTVLCSRPSDDHRQTLIYLGVQDSFPKLERYPWCSIVARAGNIHKLGETAESAELNNFGYWDTTQRGPLTRGLYKTLIAKVEGDPGIAMINSSITDAVTDAILDVDGDVLLLQGAVRAGDYVMKRLSTTLGEDLSRTLFVSGVDGLLNLDTQARFKEKAPRVRVENRIENAVVVGKMDFTGAMGTYFREVFFHAPWLIADQLYSQQNFKSALQWYRYIFDPTAVPDEWLNNADDMARSRLSDEIRLGSAPDPEPRRVDVHAHPGDAEDHRKPAHGSAAEEVAHRGAESADHKHLEAELKTLEAREKAEAKRDRVWRFMEFRNLDVPHLREILTDAATIEAYEQDPFNPHAIARLRLSAYQKCIVMNYIDVLIAQGDSLFTEFQMETVNEATLFYVLALEILGPRPDTVGDCGVANENERTYDRIAPLLKHGSAFLVEMETYTHGGTGAARAQPKFRPRHQYMISHAEADHFLKDAIAAGRRQASSAHHGRGVAHEAGGRHAIKAEAERGTAHPFHWKGAHGPSRTAAHGGAQRGRGAQKGHGRGSPSRTSGGHAPRFAASVARHMIPAFCVPPNPDLLAYWDVIEDRLFKIRNGMDITGALRQLSLFAPPIDPMMLVEATAAGLSLDDVSNTTSGDVPPYRFTYLIEKARQYASQLQGFGGALLSAIEKRDAQTLEVLRVTQQQNILAMTTAMKQADVDSAQNAVDALNAQLDTAQFRHDYYQELLDSGLNTWELTETTARMTAIGLSVLSAPLEMLGGVLHLLPQVGSPFAMKYGGLDLGHSTRSYAKSFEALSHDVEGIANASGMLGGHERRSDGWRHEVDMASKDIGQITTQLVGANIRLKSANKALDIHNRTIAQNQQVADFYTSRFSNVALYTWLATTMQSTYRQAYASAFAMAKLAEQAYRFERNDETTPLLSGTYWTQAQGGLLAGETLLGDLQRLEQRFIATNYRTPEITQSFSMMQIAPASLLNLRQNASCSFDIPELCFDLFYPGQYCRKIKAVRLTIPCVTGALTNVGATLTLTASKLRLKATDASAKPVPLKYSAVIATSTAQNDAGVFEFNFRDERYMPFEGAGAISSWKVELPDAFRQFDYQTISDVILHISYTAEQDGALRQNVEQKAGELAKTLASQPLGRLYSLRQEFPSVLNRLLHNPINTPVTLSIGANMLPFFIASSAITIPKATLLLRPAAARTVGSVAITIDGTSVTGFAIDPTLGGLWSSDVSAVFATGLFGDHAMTVTNAGDLAPATPSSPTPSPPSPGVSAAIDDTRLLDVLLYVEYSLAAA